MSSKSLRKSTFFILTILLSFCFVLQFRGERLPLKNYSAADGLAADFVHAAFRDSRGALWFGTANGLSKLEPQKEIPQPAPQVFISDLSLAGTTYGVSQFGQQTIENIEVGAGQNNLQVKFFGIGGSSVLRYQYKLVGADREDWSPPTEQRSINFGNLRSGTYRLLIRSVNQVGAVGEVPAVVGFRINHPFWRSWWFLTLVFLGLAGAVFALDRYRVAKTRQIQKAYDELQRSEQTRREAELALQKSREERLAELQRVRSRIATDLHDDIGSSLTQISLYSALARQHEAEKGKAGEPLDMITNVANELVETMSDIVWAINPKKDHLLDLTQRMRRFAANVLSAKDIEMDFSAPVSDTDIPLGANIRREVFLIYKETVNNIVKHSSARRAEIVFRRESGVLEIVFKDDGQGFELNGHSKGQTDWRKFRGGNGLLNMKRRAADLRGSYEIESKIGEGTTVFLRVPLETTDL